MKFVIVIVNIARLYSGTDFVFCIRLTICLENVHVHVNYSLIIDENSQKYLIASNGNDADE